MIKPTRMPFIAYLTFILGEKTFFEALSILPLNQGPGHLAIFPDRCSKIALFSGPRHRLQDSIDCFKFLYFSNKYKGNLKKI